MAQNLSNKKCGMKIKNTKIGKISDLMDCKNWCSSSKSSATTPTKSMTTTPTFTPIPRSSKLGASPMSDLMKEVDEQVNPDRFYTSKNIYSQFFFVTKCTL